MELDAIRAHKVSLEQHIATWLLDFTEKTGVVVAMKAEPVIAPALDGQRRIIAKVERYEVTISGSI